MLISRVLSTATRSVGRRASLFVSPAKKQLSPILSSSSQYCSPAREHPNGFVAWQVSLFHNSAISSSPFGKFGFTSSAKPEPNKKEQGNSVENNGSSPNTETEKTNGDAKVSEGEINESEAEGDLSMDDLVKLLSEKEELLKVKHKEMAAMQDKVLRAYAEMENVMERTKRESENSKKFAIQNFAKSLLDVADNLGRASSVVKDSFSKVDVSNDSAGVVPLLKTLLDGVEMTEKQLADVLKKFGVEKFDPINEPFDPNKHEAAFEFADASKPPGTVVQVSKAGYMLYDRVIRPAEVGVTPFANNDADGNKK